MRVVVKSSNNVVNSRMHILLLVTGYIQTQAEPQSGPQNRYITAVSLHFCLMLLVTDVSCQWKCWLWLCERLR